MKRKHSIKYFCSLLFLFFSFSSVNLFARHIGTGIYGISKVPIGNAADYFTDALGGGLSFEFSLSEMFGETLRMEYCPIIPKNDTIIQAWQFTQFLGLWYSMPFSQTGFSFKPEIELGLIFQGARLDAEYGELPQKAYVDFIFQFSPSLRFKNKKLLNERLELEWSPIFSFVTQKRGGLAFLGVRLGVQYIFEI